jgi:hypothetical protein
VPAPPLRRSHHFNHMVQLGKWVAKQAAYGKISFKDVAKTYASTGAVGRSSAQQIAKLRVFWYFGDEYKYEAVVWLDEWKEHRKDKLSVYDTLLDELRWKLAQKEAHKDDDQV